MRSLRSGLWLEDATTVGVVPAAGTTLLLLPMESVLTASWERLSGYNATAANPEKRPLAAVITNNPTYLENFHTPRNALPRGRPSPAQNTPSPAQKINSPKHPQPKNALSPPRNTPSPRAQGRDANYNSSANHLNINDTLLLRT